MSFQLFRKMGRAAAAGRPTIKFLINNSKATIHLLDREFSAGELCNTSPKKAQAISISKCWKGLRVPKMLQAEAWLLWSKFGLYVRFEAAQDEHFNLSNLPDLSKKTMNLWERDVCEIFLAPERNEPRRYFEFEIAPTGEWLDLAIDATGSERITDWEYSSGMEAAANSSKGFVTMAMKIPWEAFGRRPKAGDVWLGNIFRCVGSGNERGYLAWQPTMTEKPNFHVPEKFGEFVFVE